MKRLTPIFTVLAVLALAVGGAWLTLHMRTTGKQREKKKQIRKLLAENPEAFQLSTPFQMPEILDPPVLSIAAVTKMGIKDDERVIGIANGDDALAIRLSVVQAVGERETRFSDLGGKWTLVIYCTFAEKARVFMADAPIPLRIQGFSPSGEVGKPHMMLEMEGKPYQFEGEDLPLEEFEITEISPTVTTWGEWKQQHPVSKFYDGFDFEKDDAEHAKREQAKQQKQAQRQTAVPENRKQAAAISK